MLLVLGDIPRLFCLLVLKFTFLSSESHCRIVLAPSNQTTVPGGVVTFNCVVEGQGYWTVNRKDPSNVFGFNNVTISEEQSSSGAVVTTMSLTAEGILANNASQVRCHRIDDFGTTIEVSALLIIAGPPLAPRPKLVTLNSTALVLSWDKPFTWTQVADILNYTVTMYNRSHQLMEWIIKPSNGSNNFIVRSNGSVAQDCVELIFTVSASNSIGRSHNSSASGGFPIEIKWDNGSLPAITITSLSYEKNGYVSVVAEIQPPKMCPFQSAYFTLKITTADESGSLVSSSVPRAFNGSAPFQMQSVFLPVPKQRTYHLTMNVSTVKGLSEQEETAMFEIRQTVEPTEPPSSSLSNNETGCFLLLALMCALQKLTC